MITSTSRKQTAPSGYSKKPSDNKLPIVIIAIIVAMVVLFAATAASCSDQTKYDWNNLKLENSRMVYYEDSRRFHPQASTYRTYRAPSIGRQ